MLFPIILLGVSLILVIRGGDLFVAASVRLAELLSIPRVVIGSTLVSLATTSPELVVSVISGLRGESGLAMGNALGSCICNLGLILGLMALVRTVPLQSRFLATPVLLLVGACGLLMIITSDLVLDRWHGGLLCLCGLAYFAYDFWHRRQRPDQLLATEAAEIEEEVLAEHQGYLRTISGTAGQFLLGAAVVIIGSKLLVGSAVVIADAIGVPAMVVGMTVLALGTSLPELITMIAALNHQAADLAIGNILGANFANLTLVIGSAACLHPIWLERWTYAVNFPALLILLLVMCAMVVANRNLRRREGICLILFYFAYLAAALSLATLERFTPK